MTYEGESSARVGIALLIMLRSELAIGCVEPHPDKRGARSRGACRIGRRLPPYGQLYSLSLFIGHAPQFITAAKG